MKETVARLSWVRSRHEANRALAYYFEGHGIQWTSIREAVRVLAPQFGVETEKKRRSQIAIACHEHMKAAGISPPEGYVPPWARGTAAPILYRKAVRKTEASFLAFYDSIEWKRLRYDVLKARGRKCECCSADSKVAIIHVDHIKPLRKYWSLRLDPDNLQVLCEDCNRGKGSRDETDFRR